MPLLGLDPIKPFKQKSSEPMGLGIDRTPKNYVGGKQARPDGANSMSVVSPTGQLVGEVGLGNRKDIRNAVEAAASAAPAFLCRADANLEEESDRSFPGDVPCHLECWRPRWAPADHPQIRALSSRLNDEEWQPADHRASAAEVD